MDKTMLRTLNEQLATSQADAERIANSFKVEDGKFVISTEQHQDYVAAVRRAEEVKSLIDAGTSASGLGEYLAGSDETSAAAADFGAGPAVDAGMEVKDLASVFADSDAYRHALDTGVFGNASFGAVSGKVEGKSIYNFSGGTATIQALGPAENVGILEGMKRKAHIRDLFPKSTTTKSVLYGVRETGWTNNAAQINQKYAANGVDPAVGNDSTDVWGRAPKSNITLTPVMYPVAAIRHALDAHKDILSDEPRLRTFLNTRMLDGVKYAEDYALLHSVGSGEQITGLYNTPGVQTYTGLNTDNYSVQVRRAITKALLAEYEPTGLVLSPTMWEHVEVEQDKNGQFRVAVSVAIGGTKQVWRLYVVETTALDNTNFVVGAFGMGAQLHDRQSVSVSVSTEHDKNFTDGVVTFLAEERVAFEVNRPESFVIGTWTNPSAAIGFN